MFKDHLRILWAIPEKWVVPVGFIFRFFGDIDLGIATRAEVGGAGVLKEILNSRRVFTASFACSGEISISWWESVSALRQIFVDGEDVAA